MLGMFAFGVGCSGFEVFISSMHCARIVEIVRYGTKFDRPGRMSKSRHLSKPGE